MIASAGDWMTALVFHLFMFGISWLVIIRPLGGLLKWEPPEFDESMLIEDKKKRVESPDDYWEGEVNYDTGEVISDGGPTIRHPKNRDRAYGGGA